MHARFLLLLFMLVLPLPVLAGATARDQITVTAPDAVGVGQPFLVRISSAHELSGVEVMWDGKPVRPSMTRKEGESYALILLGTRLTEERTAIALEIKARLQGEGGTEGHEYAQRRDIRVAPHEYQREVLSVPPKMITPPKELQERLDRERERALAAIRTISEQRSWQLPFCLPVKGKMLSRFGLHRVFNGEVKRRHKGLDFRAFLGTPVHPIAPGTVMLVGDHYYGGNCVFIDHGNGVISSSVHLSKVLVGQGDEVTCDDTIGLSGATGRATGAHLHVSVFVQGVAVDPEPLFKMSTK